jgi:pimeloyl-ACP methyl ester carboxylesterase
MPRSALRLLPLLSLLQALTALAPAPALRAQEPMAITLETLPYPHPVAHLPVTRMGEDLRMAYMDVAPSGTANGRTVVLLHGYNFFGEYWGSTIEVLRREGYRVVVPDQVGFGRSSKPVLPYSFHQMAADTRALLESLGVQQATVIGHSMGGMLATRFALMYPEMTRQLVLLNMIGMTDSRLTSQWRSTEDRYRGLLNQTDAQIRAGQERYYVNWRPEFEKYVDVHTRWRHGAEWPRFAMVRALTGQMLYEQPVAHEFHAVRVPTLVIGGAQDGPDFPGQARAVAGAIPDARLVILEDAGHNPHLEIPDRLFPELVRFLAGG